MSCCDENTCVEKFASKCVIYTGSPAEGTFFDSKDYCNANLNEVLNDINEEITTISDNVGLDKTEFDNVNACGSDKVITGLAEHSGKYYSSDVVMKLVSKICELQERLNVLTTDDESTNPGNLYLLDVELDQEFLTWLNANSCLGDNPCDGSAITTLRGLLYAMISKTCTCCQ